MLCPLPMLQVQTGGQVAPTSEEQYSANYPQFLFGQTPGYGRTDGGPGGEARIKERIGMSLPQDIKDISMDQIKKRLQDRYSGPQRHVTSTLRIIFGIQYCIIICTLQLYMSEVY